MRSLLIGAAAWLAFAASSFAQQPAASPLPPGDGRDVVAVACTQCHGPGPFVQLRQGADAWRLQVYDMILRGAQVQPDDVDKVVGYLAASYGPGVNVPPPLHQVTLPDGKGKDLVEAQCTVCHGLDRIAMANRAPGEWNQIIHRMMFLGASVSGDDAKTITAYLDDKFGTN
ncbi:MAG: hypothetical protein JO128_10665 [Alphaproteobacteria bacterium]|nr:hypothetical protein [Alphaproteobacteria bacterium]